MKTVLLIFFLALALAPEPIIAQPTDPTTSESSRLHWFLTGAGGIQMSGIKNEDFISSNIAPLVDISTGKWFTPYLALQIGYRGYYFNTIADSNRHHYGFYYGEVVIDLNRLIKPTPTPGMWSLHLHAGSGYFYNYHYRQPNICASFGLVNNLRLTKHLHVFLDLSAIFGWDIYQGDEDILPGVTVGLTYLIPKRNRHNIERHP